GRRQEVPSAGEVREIERVGEEAAAVVESGEGDQCELAVRREEHLADVAEERQQRLEGEPVELPRGGLDVSVPAGQRRAQPQGGFVEDVRRAKVDGAGAAVREERQ